jgi:prolyl oligopeptidase
MAAGRWFRTHLPDDAAQAVAILSVSLTGNGRTLFDPVSENANKPPLVSWISPSADGKFLALGVCADGSENNTIRLVDVASGALLPNPPTQMLMDC